MINDTLQDYSQWLTPTRLEVEERLWLDESLRTWPRFLAHIIKMSQGMQKIGSIIEFGCGTGLIAPNLPAKVRYVGIDANWHCISRAKQRNPDRKTAFVNADVRAVSALEVGGDFDVACAFSFMKHFSQREWPAILGRVLSFGRRGLFSMRIGEATVDDGTEFPHLQVAPGFLEEAVRLAGHTITSVEPLPWGEGMVETCLS